MLAATNTNNPKIGNENDANAVAKQVKKIGATNMETTNKRAALSQLQNRSDLRNVTAVGVKTAFTKDGKDVKVQNGFRRIKARVDSRWKKPSVDSNDGELKVQPTANDVAAVPTKLTTRTNIARPLDEKKAAIAAMAAGGKSHFQVQFEKYQEKIRATAAAKGGIVIKPQRTKVAVKTVAAEAEMVAQPKAIKSDLVEQAEKEISTMKTEIVNLPSSQPLEAIVKVEEMCESNEPQVVKTEALPACGDLAVKLEPVANKETVGDVLAFNDLNEPEGVKNIDEDDADNLMLVSEYANDIYDYLFELEENKSIRKNHLDGQLEVNAKMRSVLLDWINEVHLQFRLITETFQLAVSITDFYLQANQTTKRSQFQLVGITALFLASKYEELVPPAISDIIFITDNTYTDKQVRQMEMQIFKSLDFDMSRPLPIHFLRRFSKAADADSTHHSLAKYFLELSMIEYEFAHYKPSEIAAACLYLSLNLLKTPSQIPSGLRSKYWTPTLRWYSHYDANHLNPIARKIAAIAYSAPKIKLKSVYLKYKLAKFQKVALYPQLYSPLMVSIITNEV